MIHNPTILQDPDARVRVLFDVSFLGRAQAGPRRSHLRGGIHRVVEQALRALSAEPSVDVTLGARSFHPYALAYVGEHPELRSLHFPVPPRTRFGLRLRQRAIERHVRSGAHLVGALPSRVANRVAGDVNRALDALTDASGASALARADVFHSPFDPLPPEWRRVRRVRYVLTVYDLIPILCPEVVTGHGGDRWLRDIVGSIGPEDHVLAISEHTRADLLNERRDLEPERVHVTHLAADPERFYPCGDAGRIAAVRAKYGVPDAPYVLAVGTLAPHKNIPHLLRAFADLIHESRVPELHLVLVGAQGWGYEAILAEVDRLGPVSDRIRFTGYVDDEDLAPLYSGALTFVCPSYYEGFGLTPLEAMRCGAPVIASNTTALPEVVGDAAITVGPHDRYALAQAMLDVYQDPERRAAMAARSLERAREFSWERHAAETAAAYRAAL